MDFKGYLTSKKIDSGAFENKEPTEWNDLKVVFDQVHPDSFTAQKLFLINKIRRNYPLKPNTEDIETKKGRLTRPVLKVVPKRQ